MLQHYGEITANKVRQKVTMSPVTNTRGDQDSDMLYNCLRKSVNDTIFAK